MKINVFVFNKINYNFPKLKIKIMKMQTGRAKLALLFLALALTLHTYSNASGQVSTGREFQMPTAQTWGFIKYGISQPSLYTGSVNVSIPFYTYRDSDFQLPISFCYSSNGMRPNVGTGPLGHDWVLNFGGCITREIKGVPDEGHYQCDVPNKTFDISYPEEDENQHSVYVNGFINTSKLDISYDDASYIFIPKWYGMDVLSHYCISAPGGPNGYYEIEPDIFHYSFMGHSGTFHLWYNNKIILYNTSDPTGTVKVDVSDNQLRYISITLGDGYKYVFGYIPEESNAFSTESTGYGYIDEFTADQYYTDAWYLYKVIAPGGRVMYIDYEPNSNSEYIVDYYSPVSLYSNTESQLTYSGWPIYHSISQGSQITPILKVVALPAGVHFSDSTARVVFTYYPHYDIQEEINSTGGTIGRFINKLKTISIINGLSDTIKRCSFKYKYTRYGNNIAFLDTLNISGEGKYSFDYIGLENGSSATFPKFGTFSVDHWGYYNGRLDSNTDISFNFADPSMFSIDSLYDEHIMSVNRDASYYSASLGLLNRVNYPTKGYAILSYEPNTYSKDVRRDHTTGFYPYLKNDNANVQTGGLRIKSIANYDSDNVMTDSKKYYYTLENSMLSSGIQLYFPRYNLIYDRQTELGPESVEFISGNDVNSYGTGNVEYSRVIEKSSDSSKIVYDYSNYSTMPDYPVSEDRPIMYRGFGGNGGSDAASLLSPVCSESYARGKLLEKSIYNREGVLLLQESTDYSYGTIDNDYYLTVKAGETAKKVNTFLGNDKIPRINVVKYAPSGNISNSISNDYDNFDRVIYNQSQTSGNHIKIQTSKYADNIGNTGIYKSLIHRNMLTVPIVQTTTFGLDTASSIMYQYDSLRQDSGNYIVIPTSLKKYNPENRTYETYFTYKYDKQGRIIEVSDRNGIYTSYIWGYRGLCIVAKVDNATLAQIKTVSGLSNIDSSPLPSGVDDYDVPLRAITGAQVTTFSYKPLIGLTSIKDPSQKIVRYDYNKQGKLYKIVDHHGHLVNKYHYSTDNR